MLGDDRQRLRGEAKLGQGPSKTGMGTQRASLSINFAGTAVELSGCGFAWRDNRGGYPHMARAGGSLGQAGAFERAEDPVLASKSGP